MGAPLAYFLSWTAYGSWLHGDERGSVDDRHNVPGTPYLFPDQRRLNRERAGLHRAPDPFSRNTRDIIEQTIRDHCDYRGWRLLAANVRTQHVHVVVSCSHDVPPERAMDQFKAWATRRLREAGLAPRDARLWTRHGSTRWIDTPASLEKAIDYVLNQQ